MGCMKLSRAQLPLERMGQAVYIATQFSSVVFDTCKGFPELVNLIGQLSTPLIPRSWKKSQSLGASLSLSHP